MIRRQLRKQAAGNKRRALVGLSLFLILLAGCTTPPPAPSQKTRQKLGRVYLMAVPATPDIAFNTFAKNSGQGARKGAAEGAAGSFAYSAVMYAPLAGVPPLYTVMVGMNTILGTLAGSVIGSAESIPANTANRIEKHVNAAFRQTDLAHGLVETIDALSQKQPDMQKYGIAYNTLPLSSPDTSSYVAAARQGYNTVMEIRVPAAGFEGGTGSTPAIRFYMVARITLVDTKFGTTLYTQDFRYNSEPESHTFWFNNNYRELMNEIYQANIWLADNITDNIFLEKHFPFPDGKWTFPTSDYYGACSLSPIYPVLHIKTQQAEPDHFQTSLAPSPLFVSQPAFEPVDSLQPTLV